MATIKDVAREAGLTVGTVSRVLNNRGYISSETRDKVYEVMRRLNYQPNELARSLYKKVNNTIGVIVPRLVHPYFAWLVNELLSEASRAHYKVLLYKSEADTRLEHEYIDMCRANQVAGIVLCSPSVDAGELRELHVPIITIERNGESATGGIICDNYRGGVLAAQHLIERGCRNLIHFSGIVNETMPADRRAEGFAGVCRESGIPYRIIPCVREDYEAMDYSGFLEKTLEANAEADGIFASNDILAAQIVQYCAKHNITVPEKMKIIGFDDTNIASFCTPPLTTIRQPVREMAGLAIRMLCGENEGVPMQSVFPVSLIIRETT